MKVKLYVVLLAGLMAGGVFAASVWDGIYTEDQAKLGDQDYHRECGSCHGAEMEGKGQAPPLAGTEFTGNWNGMTVGDLFEKIQGSMPADRPGQLSADQNATILAYILQYNKFPSGKKELAGDIGALGKIRFEAARADK
jgi:mono/diheme cytochrome c family protein